MDELDLSILEKLYDDIVNIAMEDNILTADEKAILDKTRESIDNFIKFYEKAIEDNVIDEKEFQQLIKAYTRIYKDPESAALKDEVLKRWLILIFSI